MSILFVASPLESFDAGIDTTLGLMHAAQDSGEDVFVTEAQHLEFVDGRPRALARRVWLSPSQPAGGCRWTVPDPWFYASTPHHIWIDRMAAVFMRTEPPLDEAYLTATLILELVDPTTTALVNDPAGLRACNEHLLPLQFPDLVPPTVVSADPAVLQEFVAEHGLAVLKPIDGFGGHGVLRLEPTDPNLHSLIEISTRAGSRTVLVQRFLPEVADGNKRVFLLDEEPVAAIHRFPLADDFRIDNPSCGAPITGRDREICRRLAPMLSRHGLRMVGLDIIGGHLIEVNITSPGALRKADALLGSTLCAETVDRILRDPTTERKSA